MTEKKKINWLLILQGWAMLWVVIGHAFLGTAGEGPAWENVLFHFAYSFHMPLFMLVSGWLFYRTRMNDKWPYNKLLKDKALRLLLPGLVFSIVAYALKVAFPGEMSRQVGLNLREIVHQYLYPNDNPMRELWFIVTLFWFFVMTPLWKVVLKRAWTMWLMVAVLMALHFWNPSIELLCINRVLIYAIWFYLGIVISKTDLVDRLFSKHAWLTLLVGIAIYVAGRMTIAIITTVGGIVLSFGLALMLDQYLPKTFSTFRNYTYQIFLMGIFAQMFVKILYRHFSMPYVVAYLFCIAIGIYVPVLVSKLIEKINWRPLSLCAGLKT